MIFTPFVAVIAEIRFLMQHGLLFRIDGNDRLTGTQKHFHLIVDVLELNVPMVVGDIPMASSTNPIPPHPSCRASVAAQMRHPRSCRTPRTASYFSRSD
jgi:hypothetical protein